MWWTSLDIEHNNRSSGRSLQPIHVKVHAGEVLYLPALWWHAVSQRGTAADPSGATVAVNYWYSHDVC